MLHFKKILAFSLVAVLLLSTITIIGIAEPKNTEDKAKVLYDLGILKGSNNQFDLEGQLTRAMAATFVVRMLGVESEVLESSSLYSNTGFTDVPKNEWYTAYVGYCAQEGIIGGYQGKYNPNDMISEKQFLKLILGVLGYIQDEDFLWSDVYKTAYEKGIVTDKRYKIKLSDDLEYTRGSAIDALYNALTIPNKTTKKTVIENFVSKKLVTEDKAVGLGLWKRPDVPTTIKNIIVDNSTTVNIVLSETVADLAAGDVVVYEKANPNNKLNAVIAYQGNGLLKLSTSQQEENKAYVVKLSNLIDADKNIIASLTTEFNGYDIPEIASDFFKISKIVALDEKSIKVYFTQPLDTAAELQFFYEIFSGQASFVRGSFSTMTVKNIPSEPNSVILYLNNNTFTEGKEYTLKILGELTSKFGATLNKGIGGEAVFVGSGKKEEALSVVSTSIIENNVVEIVFNKVVDSESAQTLANYSLKKGTTIYPITKAAVSGEGTQYGKVVRVKSSTNFSKTDTYDLVVSNVKDILKKNIMTSSSTTVFGGTMLDNKLQVLGVYAVNQREIMIIVNKRLNQQSAQDITKYYVTGDSYAAMASRVYYDPNENPYVIKLYLPSVSALNSSKIYSVNVSNGLKDEMDNASTENLKYTFAGSGEAQLTLYPTEAKIVGDKIIKLTFNSEIYSGAPNNSATNYTIEYIEGNSRTIVQCNEVKVIDEKTIILRFDDLKIDKNYTLKLASLVSYAGDTITYSEKTHTAAVIKGQE